MLDEIYRGFSCPGQPLHPEVLDAVVTEHMRRAVAAFLEHRGGNLARSSDGLVEYLSGWLGFDATVDDVWNSAFGAIEGLARPDAPEPPEPPETPPPPQTPQTPEITAAAARLALAMQAAGLAGSFRASLGAPVRLRFDRFLLGEASELRVAGSGAELAVELGGGRQVVFARFARSGGRWQSLGPRDDHDGQHGNGWQEELRQVPIDRRTVTFVTGAALGDERQEGLPYGVTAATDEVTAAWTAAFDLIRRHSPEYLQWVDRGIRDIVPLAVGSETMVSASHTQRWGEVYMTSALPPLKLAEMLVHEVSHQHYFFGGFLAAVEDGSDTHLYYSPVKKTGRPIDKILLAYHAFANVVLFYRQCREAGLDTGFEEAAILPELAQLEAPLRQTTGLTALGRAFWEPLAESIAGRD
jgi:HEXXH motif-containing protein